MRTGTTATFGIFSLLLFLVASVSSAGAQVVAPTVPGLRLLEGPPFLIDDSEVGSDSSGRVIVAQQGTAETGTVAPTEEEATRALERLLVTRGALVLPRFAREIEPEVRYRYSGSAAQNTRRDTFTAALTGRLGLPFDSQVEVRVPYVLHDETDFDTTSGLADVSVLLTKEILRERDASPNLLLSARWTAPTGEENFTSRGLGTGSGFHVIEGLITSSLRRDPLVFFGTASYAATLPARKIGLDIDPGDVFGFKTGGILAASPETSVTIALNMAFSGRVEIEGHRVRGTDQVVGVVELGVAHILTRRLLLDVRAEIGVTDDAPDVALIVSFPFRF
jgi:hypothetical protein